jgi:FtsP/CotA-like multicopper oxidase with cupredoxin domain
MNAKIVADRRPATVSRRAGLRYAGVLALAAAGWLFDPRPAWAQTGKTRFFVLDIRHGKVPAAQRTIRVAEGDRVELRWTADEAVELHLHGYDIRLDLKPGAPASMTLYVHTAGRFPVGIHGSGGHGHGNVVYLEVHPR